MTKEKVIQNAMLCLQYILFYEPDSLPSLDVNSSLVRLHYLNCGEPKELVMTLVDRLNDIRIAGSELRIKQDTALGDVTFNIDWHFDD